MTAVYNYSRDVNTKEGKELLKQKAELAQEQMAIKWSLINIARKSEDVFQPPEQCCSEIGFQQPWRERGLGWAWMVPGQFLAEMTCPESQDCIQSPGRALLSHLHLSMQILSNKWGWKEKRWKIVTMLAVCWENIASGVNNFSLNRNKQ